MQDSREIAREVVADVLQRLLRQSSDAASSSSDDVNAQPAFAARDLPDIQEEQDEGYEESPFPRRVQVPVPAHARLCYKVVALVDDEHFVSIFDGRTRYVPGTTIRHVVRPGHGGGIYVSETIRDCLVRDEGGFPQRSALIHAPRAIARVMAWNDDRLALPVRYGLKLSYTYVHVLDMLPYPQTWGAKSLLREGVPGYGPPGAPLRAISNLNLSGAGPSTALPRARRQGNEDLGENEGAEHVRTSRGDAAGAVDQAFGPGQRATAQQRSASLLRRPRCSWRRRSSAWSNGWHASDGGAHRSRLNNST
eukprot:jgi/Mesvir1/10882/Mv01591-RA.1